MKRLEDHTVYTHGGSITADNIIIAVDKLEKSISSLADEVFHAQTFLSITEPLNDKELDLLFPDGSRMQCWDSNLVYTYFRLTQDNRLLLGGGSALMTFLPYAFNNPTIINSVIKGFRKQFPFLTNLSFIQFWPGLIDTTRDLIPLLTRPPEHPHLHFVLGAVGLPWAAFAGSFAGRYILGHADDDVRKYSRYLSSERPFALPAGIGRVLGKPILFSLSNSWAKFRQVDKRDGRLRH